MDKKISFAGKEIIYRVTGNGFPVLLIHGFAEDGTLWDSAVSRLERKYCVIVPDLPGSGASPFNPSLKTIEDLAESIKAIIGAEKIAQCIVVGHSMGGYIALALAEKYPETLKGLGLFHSTAFADSEEKKNTRRKSIEFIREHGSAEFIQISSPNLYSEKFKKDRIDIISAYIRKYESFDPDALVAYYEAMIQRPDRTDVLKNFPQPVLFIMGQEDKAAPLDDVLKQSHMPDISFIRILTNTAHMGMLENPVPAFDELENFLEQTLRFY